MCLYFVCIGYSLSAINRPTHYFDTWVTYKRLNERLIPRRVLRASRQGGRDTYLPLHVKKRDAEEQGLIEAHLQDVIPVLRVQHGLERERHTHTERQREREREKQRHLQTKFQISQTSRNTSYNSFLVKCKYSPAGEFLSACQRRTSWKRGNERERKCHK